MAQGNNKYSNDTKMEAMGLWALGKSFKEIAKKLSVSSHRTIESWKQNNNPCSWDEYAEKLRSDSVEKMKVSQLESIDQVRIRQQRWIKVLGNHAIQTIVQKAKNGALEPKIAIDVMKFICEMELKLYVPVEKVFGSGSTKPTFADKFAEQQQKTYILDYMNDAFDKANGFGKYAELDKEPVE